MITIRKSSDRGHFNHGWLDTRHTFSFADYVDPAFTRFRSLRVLNDDIVAPGQGFGTHPHRDVEIVTYVLSGQLEHGDSMGHRTILNPGDVQRISAGTGILHSEANASATDPVHFLQIWIMPHTKGVTPDHTERTFNPAEGQTLLIASGTSRDSAIPIHQDAEIYAARLAASGSAQHQIAPGRAAWLQLIDGSLTVNGVTMQPGDGAAIESETALHLHAPEKAHYLFFDLN